MSTSRIHLLGLLAASVLFASSARADNKTYAKILKDREAVLSQIVHEREGEFTTGTKDAEALTAARLALWSFRRDTASSRAEKVKQQQLIVATFEKKLAEQNVRAKAGIAPTEDILLATDSLLQAQQLLEELQQEPKKS